MPLNASTPPTGNPGSASAELKLRLDIGKNSPKVFVKVKQTDNELQTCTYQLLVKIIT